MRSRIAIEKSRDIFDLVNREIYPSHLCVPHIGIPPLAIHNNFIHFSRTREKKNGVFNIFLKADVKALCQKGNMRNQNIIFTRLHGNGIKSILIATHRFPVDGDCCTDHQFTTGGIFYITIQCKFRLRYGFKAG